MSFFAVVGCLSAGMDYSLDQIGYLYSASIPSQMVLSRIWVSVAIVHNNMDCTVQNIYLSVSHSNKLNTPSGVRLVASLMNFECQPCGIFVGLDQPQ